MLVLQIEPTFSPSTDGVKHLQIKVRFGVPNGYTHLPYNVLRIHPLYTKEVLPEPPMGIDPQESLTKGNKSSNVQNPIGSQIVQLKPIGVQQTTNKRVNRKSKLAREERLKAHPLMCRGSGNRFIPRNLHGISSHQAISNQRAEICNPKSRALPLARHLGRFRSSTGARCHQTHSKQQQEEGEGLRTGEI